MPLRAIQIVEDDVLKQLRVLASSKKVKSQTNLQLFPASDTSVSGPSTDPPLKPGEAEAEKTEKSRPALTTRLDIRMLLTPLDLSSKVGSWIAWCGAHFATQAACKNHHCAPDDQEEDYEGMSDDNEVAVHVPESPENIPIISDLTDCLRSDLVEDRPDLE
ncbi:hypothetical protein BV898_09318 [Hypsibius exemplaris]|uniref:Uncharacterized protein n=1 Tax=Hypsibius exemplaris TaxID=2072580 RepID=A0A1W0WN72_HYPEX|nr:hypothetical protein BV898_09318 [Hypsibius exemplaris]